MISIILRTLTKYYGGAQQSTVTSQELNPRSRLLSGGKMFRGDLVEGIRGTPNFGAACSALALKHELLFQVMPDDQVGGFLINMLW